MKIPLNLIYERFKYFVPKLGGVGKEPTPEEMKKQEMDKIFSFKDPRLRHLNKGFRREEQQVREVDFADDPGAFKAAIDEIIKFNCFTNEFNYVHELFSRISDKLIIEKTGGYNWVSLFTLYDENKNNLLDKPELK